MPVRPLVSEPIMVKTMDLYGEVLDFVFSFGIEKLKLILFLLCVLAEKAAALLRSETPMEREDVCGCAGLR